MADRVDENGAAYAGSQLQTQLYVNKRTTELDASIRAALPELADATLEWRSPLARDGYREYWDAAFLARLGLDEHVNALKRFWPTGGPHWDALALVYQPGDGRPGVLLAEGKRYPNEMLKGSGTTAAGGSPSRALIEKSLAWTQGRLGIPLDTNAWTGPLYQNGVPPFRRTGLGFRALLLDFLIWVCEPRSGEARTGVDESSRSRRVRASRAWSSAGCGCRTPR
jgi:hypothetical protein